MGLLGFFLLLMALGFVMHVHPPMAVIGHAGRAASQREPIHHNAVERRKGSVGPDVLPKYTARCPLNA
jgi:hypothetical protein